MMANMSIEQCDNPRAQILRQEGAARERSGVRDRSLPMLPALEAARIARDLTEKYGSDALAFARDRAARAIEVGDDLAHEAWQSVIDATRRLLHGEHGAEAAVLGGNPSRLSQ
jgi:hypothetical protein